MKYTDALQHFGESENRGFSIIQKSQNTIFGRHNKEKFTSFIKFLKETEKISEAVELAGIAPPTGYRYTKIFFAECQRRNLPQLSAYKKRYPIEVRIEQRKEGQRLRMRTPECKEKQKYRMRERRANGKVKKANKKPNVYSIEELIKIHSDVLPASRSDAKSI